MLKLKKIKNASLGSSTCDDKIAKKVNKAKLANDQTAIGRVKSPKPTFK